MPFRPDAISLLSNNASLLAQHEYDVYTNFQDIPTQRGCALVSTTRV